MRSTYLATVVVSCWAWSALAAQDAVSKVVSAEEVEARTTRVMRSYDWTQDLEKLQKRAAEEGKLAFWLQIVGELDDGL